LAFGKEMRIMTIVVCSRKLRRNGKDDDGEEVRWERKMEQNLVRTSSTSTNQE
jgi:hypothetical protein